MSANSISHAFEWPDPMTAGAARAYNGDPTATTAIAADGHDAIREGKQKAKETLAAAGLDPGASPAARQQSSTPNGSAQMNGAPLLSRKRSRDGTRLPMTERGANGQHPSHDEILLNRYIQRDLLDAALVNEHRQQRYELTQMLEQRRVNAVREHDERRRRVPLGHFPQYVYASSRPTPNRRRNLPLQLRRKDNQQQAEQHEELVPVRLELELDKLRLRDTFTWNLHEKLISQQQFIAYLLEDLRIPPESLVEVAHTALAEMQDQIQNYFPHIIIEDGPLEPGRAYSEHKDDEMRIQIKLNITIGRVTLVDQFEWDINNPENSPEEFARSMACENALSGEFTTAIAHSIREQSQLYTKSLFLTNHSFDGCVIEDVELRESFLHGPIASAFRPAHLQKDYTPFMYEMSEAELERTETSMLREHRAAKRQLNRRGGPALPDLKDRQRTVRSLIVHTVLPGGVETFETTGIIKMRRGGRSRGRTGTRPDGDVDSEELESDESGGESPGPSMLQPGGAGGTARTRGMRGAAAAAQASMRGAFNRSQTPDSAIHEPRAGGGGGGRRSMLREGSVAHDAGNTSTGHNTTGEELVVRLKIPKAKLKAWWDAYRAKKKASEYPLSGYASQPIPAATALATSIGAGSGTPHSTSRSLPHTGSTPQPNGGGGGGGGGAGAGTGRSSRSAQQQQQQQQQQYRYDERGAIDIDTWPHADEEVPPPPAWLATDLATLHARAPHDDFTAHMRPYQVNLDTGRIQVDPDQRLAPGARAPPGWKLQWQPRIRCNDCLGKWYNAKRNNVLKDFDVHLKNKAHLEHVRERVEGGAGSES